VSTWAQAIRHSPVSKWEGIVDHSGGSLFSHLIQSTQGSGRSQDRINDYY
jgi:hypothetical protein